MRRWTVSAGAVVFLVASIAYTQSFFLSGPAGIPRSGGPVSGPLGIPDGAVGAPGLYFTDDADNGLYRIGADEWGLSYGGVLGMSCAEAAGDVDCTFDNTLLAGDGSAGTPAFGFADDATTGLYRVGASAVGMSLGGALNYQFSANQINAGGVSQFRISRATASSTVPVFIPRQDDPDSGLSWVVADQPSITAGGVLAMTFAEATTITVTAEDKLGVASSEGQRSDTLFASETLTFSGGAGDASKTTSGLIPDGAFLLAVTSRVITAPTGCTTIDIGDGSDVDLFADEATVADTDTTDNSDATAAFANPILAATEVTVTGSAGGNCIDLVIQITAHYTTFTAATSG